MTLEEILVSREQRERFERVSALVLIESLVMEKSYLIEKLGKMKAESSRKWDIVEFNKFQDVVKKRNNIEYAMRILEEVLEKGLFT